MCRILLVAAGLMLGNMSLATLASAQERTDPQAHEGMVVSASGTQISIKGADGKEKSFKTNERTRIMVNGKPGKLEELKPGVMVRVMVDAKGVVTSVSTVDDRKRI